MISKKKFRKVLSEITINEVTQEIYKDSDSDYLYKRAIEELASAKGEEKLSFQRAIMLLGLAISKLDELVNNVA